MSSPISIGVLHSLQGPMAISEAPLVDAAVLAVEEINAQGGVLGHPLRTLVADGRSDPAVFQTQARKLIREHKAAALFGCWTSSSRKAVRPVLEQEDSLLWYPVQYEGLEQCPDIVYTGSCLNQQIQPFIEWCVRAGRRRFFLVGSDYVFPRTANKLIHALLRETRASVVGEAYFPLDSTDFTSLLPLLRVAEPDMIVNTVNGSGNAALFAQVVSDKDRLPGLTIGSMSCSEVEHAALGLLAAGSLACWGYFQSIRSEENSRFIAAFRSRFGEERMLSDPIAAAYAQIHLWASLVRKTGLLLPGELKQHLPGHGLPTPLGWLEIQANNHVARQALVGIWTGEGKFDVLWQSPTPIAPLPWLGMESLPAPASYLVRDVLQHLPEDIATRARLEQEVAGRERVEQALRQSEQELRHQEELWRTTLSNVSDSVLLTDTSGVITFVCPNTRFIFGYEEAEVWALDRIENLLPELVFDPVELERLGALENLRCPIRDKFGRRHETLVGVKKVDFHEHRYLYTIHDATELIEQNEELLAAREQAQTALASLRFSESNFNALFMAMTEAVVLHDLVFDDQGKAVDYRITDCNPAFVATTGIARDQAVGRLATEVYATPSAPYLEEYALVAVTGEPYSFITCFAPMGRHFSISVVSPQPNTFATITLDVTSVKKAEERLKASSDRLQTVMNSIEAFIYIADMRTHELLFVNEYAKKAWHEDLIGRKCHNALQGLDDPCPFCTNSRLVDDQGQPTGVCQWEFQNTVNNRWYDIRDQAIQWTDGRIVRMEIATDITERKLAEQLITAKNKELEQVVYVASHDLRSPLVNVDGYGRELEYALREMNTALEEASGSVDALKAALQPSLGEMAEALKYIRSSTSQMDGLLKGLLKLSRAGRTALNITVLDMDELVAGVVASMEYQVEAAGVSLAVETLPPCMGDRVQVTQVFSNILGNALKFLDPDRPGVIRVSGLASGNRLEYCIEDNGIGIAKAHQEKIFELFHRLDPQRNEGEGLGLTIVRQVLERLGGSVRLESQHGQGSRFFVTLPAVPKAERVRAKEEE